MDVVARVDRRFDSSTIRYDFLLSFILTGYDGCIESDSKSIERYKTGVKVGVQENKLFSSLQKKILSSYLGSTRRAQNGKPGHTNLLIKAL